MGKVINSINKQMLINLVISNKIRHIHIFLLSTLNYKYSFKYNQEKIETT